MSKLDTLIQDLVIANRILAKEDVVDAYGHISVRHPDNPNHFFISRSLAPELIEKDDIVELDLDGQPVGDEKRSLYLERFIHAGIYHHPSIGIFYLKSSPGHFAGIVTAPFHYIAPFPNAFSIFYIIDAGR